MKKYLNIFTYSVRDQIIYIKSFLIKNVFFIIIIFIFYSLWKVVFADKLLIAGLVLDRFCGLARMGLLLIQQLFYFLGWSGSGTQQSTGQIYTHLGES